MCQWSVSSSVLGNGDQQTPAREAVESPLAGAIVMTGIFRAMFRRKMFLILGNVIEYVSWSKIAFQANY
jgi:hypothetical protein